MSIQKLVEELDELETNGAILCYALHYSDEVNNIEKIILGINTHTVVEISSNYISKWFGPVSFPKFKVVKDVSVHFNRKKKKYELQFHS